VNPLASILSFSRGSWSFVSAAAEGGDDGTLLWVAIIGAVPLTISAVAALVAARRAGQINRAVNHQPPTEPRLLDIIKGMDEKQDLMAEKLDRHLGWHAGHDARARSGSDYLDEGV
jgi:hypothetical protein